MKVLYKPFGLLVSVLGGLVAGAVFTRVWRAVFGEDNSPSATDRDRGWGEVIGAAALHGAVFGTVKAVIDRGAAKGFERTTGVWPGETDSRGE